MKLCKDCKHFEKGSISAKCYSPSTCHVRLPGHEPEFDPVTGREDRQIHDPRAMRRSGFCGPDAKLFEERQSIIKRIFG